MSAGRADWPLVNANEDSPPMKEMLGKIALGPLLLLQGRYTRRVTPTLPEAAGERRGDAGAGPVLRLLIVGDSAAAGVGVATQDRALAGQLVSRLSDRFQVSWALLAESGFNTAQLLHLLEHKQQERFDVAVVSIGVNDATGNRRVKDWIVLQHQLADVLRDRFGIGRILLSPVPPMHLFPALPQPLRWYLGVRASNFNRCLAEFAGLRNDCTLLPANFPMDARLMAEDGFHPGVHLYAMWAEDAARAIRHHCLSGMT